MLFDQEDRYPKDVEVHLHTLARNIIFVQDNAIIWCILACLGMTVPFLTGDDLLNNYTHKRKDFLAGFNSILLDKNVTLYV